MIIEKASSSQPPARKMAAGDASEEVNGMPTKRLRTPSVRLNQSYYETSSGRRKSQQQSNIGATKSRTLKTLDGKISKKSNNGQGFEDFNFDDDDVAIRGWRNFYTGKRCDVNFKPKSKRKRFIISPSGSNEDQENEKFVAFSSSGSETGKQREREQEGNSGANGMNTTNLEAQRNSDRHCSVFGNDRLIDDDRNAVHRDNGVGAWLSRLALGKYASLFEVHEVDDAVLPFLTLDDLKDMGISAVGTRRKMYRSIKKLGEGFS